MNYFSIWSDNFYDLSVFVGEVLIKFLDDSITPALYESMDNVVAKYTQESSEKRLSEIYEEYITQRIALLEGALQTEA